MPYLQDEGSINKVFNLLGFPLWMNGGRILQYLLGLAESLLYIHYRVTPFDERYK